ncbi:hypothetical protein [Aphanothece sacrum]|uniref:Uncharacterized protein n=1 Tax=Aphanothece sacrum FPU1 TaxID=1920663 RepID=A0A401IGY8_APHSA|nr:hypothetical protein [Aphanothece sacrum]GBF80528.1 hypothetical protein AsFPU1_1929 [Aphanothece sacrum FPU1]GBF85919.1 hypothetical protein AsFPU3_2989 [Aphanothece sacrum FPU3]
MFKRLLAGQWFRPTVSLGCLLTGWLLTANVAVQAQTDAVVPSMAHRSFTPSMELSPPEFDLESEPETSTIPDDPLDSPYPIPWPWLLETQQEFNDKQVVGQRYYRSQALVSPDGEYAAYTRINMVADPQLYRSQATSVMFLENLKTGELQVIRAGSPIAAHLQEIAKTEEVPGAISILMPISWSANGDRLLSRQVEGFFSTSDVTDYGVIWERQTNQTTTLKPSEDEESTAILLGWNNVQGEQVLFQTGQLGDEDWPVLAVSANGQTVVAKNPEPVTYGRLVSRSWTGSQTLQ